MGELKLNGRIILINDSEQVNDKLTKRTFVVETDDKYPQKIQFEAINDKTKLLDKCQVGSSVSVDFNLRGREYNGKHGVQYFNSLSVWRINAAEGTDTCHGYNTANVNNGEDDLPF